MLRFTRVGPSVGCAADEDRRRVRADPFVPRRTGREGAAAEPIAAPVPRAAVRPSGAEEHHTGGHAGRAATRTLASQTTCLPPTVLPDPEQPHGVPSAWLVFVRPAPRSRLRRGWRPSHPAVPRHLHTARLEPNPTRQAFAGVESRWIPSPCSNTPFVRQPSQSSTFRKNCSGVDRSLSVSRQGTPIELWFRALHGARRAPGL